MLYDPKSGKSRFPCGNELLGAVAPGMSQISQNERPAWYLCDSEYNASVSSCLIACYQEAMEAKRTLVRTNDSSGQ